MGHWEINTLLGLISLFTLFDILDLNVLTQGTISMS